MEKVLAMDDSIGATVVVEVPGPEITLIGEASGKDDYEPPKETPNRKEQREPTIKKGKMHVSRYKARRRKMKMQAESRRRNR
jgi:hypothetical protein